LKIKMIITASVLTGLLLSGCQAKDPVKKQATSASNTSSKVAKQSVASSKQVSSTKKETPPASEMTTVLSKLSAKLPEDDSTQNNGEVTYSQFYYQNDNWHWKMSSKQRGTIIGGKVQSLTKTDASYKLAMVTDSGEQYQLTLDYYLDENGETAEDYTVTAKANGQSVKGTYIIGDNDAAWTAGVPATLAGTWSTDFYKPTDSSDDDTAQKAPYERTRFYISNDSLDGVKDSFTANYTFYSGGAGWGVNQDPEYKKIDANTYLLKTHTSNGALFAVYRAKLVNNQLTLDNSSDTSSMTKVSSKAGKYMGFDDNPAKNLTTSQVQDWVFRHINDFDAHHTHYKKVSFIMGHNKKGEVTIEARDDGGSGMTAPMIGQFVVTAGGVLKCTFDPTDTDGVTTNVVSDDPNR